MAQCELKKHFDTIASEVQSLQKFVSDSTLFLTAYDIRNSQQVWLLTHFYLPCIFAMYLCHLFTMCLLSACIYDFHYMSSTPWRLYAPGTYMYVCLQHGFGATLDGTCLLTSRLLLLLYSGCKNLVVKHFAGYK